MHIYSSVFLFINIKKFVLFKFILKQNKYHLILNIVCRGKQSLGGISIMGLRSILKSYKDRCHRGHIKVSAQILALRRSSVGTNIRKLWALKTCSLA